MTPHGFRAAARTMLHERLGYDPDVIEAQLPHRVPDRLGGACNRAKHLEARKKMMQNWAVFLMIWEVETTLGCSIIVNNQH